LALFGPGVTGGVVGGFDEPEPDPDEPEPDEPEPDEPEPDEPDPDEPEFDDEPEPDDPEFDEPEFDDELDPDPDEPDPDEPDPDEPDPELDEAEPPLLDAPEDWPLLLPPPHAVSRSVSANAEAVARRELRDIADQSLCPEEGAHHRRTG
jgi:hypothetical protein